MNSVFKRYVLGFLIALFLSGCATHTPRKMYKGEIKNEKDVATIIGINDWTNWNRPVTLRVHKLDGETLYGSPNVLHVDPGSHELVLSVSHDRMMALKLPVLKVSVKAGQVYQLDYRLIEHRASLRESTGTAVYSLRYIGDHKDYEDYLAKNPEYKAGTPLFIPSAG
ncbi:hypothetical protein SAMN05216315_10368 [Nitrosospira sp. Nsp18]|uniref:hypothetical protein n=1 Tax=Nitrosospira sp. Nsp18 TaxID=1855334 RepID=UPI00088838D5|nr:hypothetical protein [Nitrosospira sp. Nsp18]SDA12219.1 hypothetical protein SAMN05216315_10368 [Nitrosospira sp. Nsp18]